MIQRETIGLIQEDTSRKAWPRGAGRWLHRLFGGFLMIAVALPFGACGDDEEDLVPVLGGPGERYARAAIFLASCTPPRNSDDKPPYIGEELRLIYQDLLQPGPLSTRVRADAMVGCFEAATNGCAALFDCLGESFEAADRAEPCLPACEGQVHTSCETYEEETIYYHRRIDCGRSAMTCSEDGCLAEPEPAPTPCKEGTKYPRCEGDVPLYCFSNEEERQPACGEAALACVLLDFTSYESATCQGTQGACENNTYTSDIGTNGGFRCRGTVTDMCVEHGVHPVDCATLGEGFTCVGEDVVKSCGLADECHPFQVKPRCDGTKLLFCNAGVLQAVDCAALGFSGCDAGRGACAPGFYQL